MYVCMYVCMYTSHHVIWTAFPFLNQEAPHYAPSPTSYHKECPQCHVHILSVMSHAEYNTYSNQHMAVQYSIVLV